jgi:large subunit ribosomal protein L7/L12
MALSNQEILDAIAAKSVLEISELIKLMEEKFGVSAAAAAVAVAAPAGGGAAAPAAEEQTEFTLSGRVGANKVNVIKAVRELTGWAEGRRTWSTARRNPSGRRQQGRRRRCQKKLEEAGAKVEVK